MENLHRKIKELERYRITYFLHSPDASLETYKRDLRDEANQLIQEIPLNAAIGVGFRGYLVGKILNICPDYEPKCEEQLEQSLLANSTLIDAWLELAQCVWKRSDLEKAHACFKMAVERERSAKALCMLSAVLRAFAARETNLKNRLQTLNEAMELCQEALKKRKDYPFAWYSLANTYLTRFFSNQQTSDLTSALDAFKKALACPSAVPFVNPDLHLNYGQTLYYSQNYAESLVQFRQALVIEPHFSQAQQKYISCKAYLHQLRESVVRKAHLSQRRLTSILETFPKSTGTVNGKEKIKEFVSAKELCDYTYKSSKIDAANHAITVRCIGQLSNQQQIPFTMVCIDRAGAALALTVYNCSEKFSALIGDTFTVIQPLLIRNKFSDLDDEIISNGTNKQGNETNEKVNVKENQCAKQLILILRVFNPERQLLKNGRQLSAECYAFPSLSIQINDAIGHENRNERKSS